MHPYPHHYVVSAAAEQTGVVAVTSADLPKLETEPPPEFGGPGGHWSPETLLCAAVADCFVLTFRGISRAARLDWRRLECRVEGTLERSEGVSKFTRYQTFARLTLPAGADPSAAHALLERAERTCLVSNSLTGTRTLAIEIATAAADT